ncbi:hypothetical protein A6770_25345 [Nostoc minutum NIES-26]|uniref:Uncharacterized protein n=1 Tax=Nostoc minutum NIES-26 TaxID=1844469 RepID=A0A367QVK4_9NOSO|nr:hypothetical protein A6770_25345 [Nostoc minutum NIES-26]
MLGDRLRSIELRRMREIGEMRGTRRRITTSTFWRQCGEALAVFSQRGDAGAKAVSVESKVLLAQRSASPLPRGATDGYAGVSPS